LGWHKSELLVYVVEMARTANNPVFEPSAKGFETVRKQYFSDDVISGRYGPLQSACRKIFVFCKVSKSNNEFFWLLFSPFYRSANVPFHLFPRKSVNHVMNQSKQRFHL